MVDWVNGLTPNNHSPNQPNQLLTVLPPQKNQIPCNFPPPAGV